MKYIVMSDFMLIAYKVPLKSYQSRTKFGCYIRL